MILNRNICTHRNARNASHRSRSSGALLRYYYYFSVLLQRIWPTRSLFLLLFFLGRLYINSHEASGNQRILNPNYGQWASGWTISPSFIAICAATKPSTRSFTAHYGQLMGVRIRFVLYVYMYIVYAYTYAIWICCSSFANKKIIIRI